MGRKLGVLSLFGGRGPESPSNTMSLGQKPTSLPSGILIHPGIWPQQIRAENWGLCPFGGGEVGSHLTQCGLGPGLPPYQVATWSIKSFGYNRHGLKVGRELCPFNAKSPGPSPTSIPSGILIQPAICPQQIRAENWGLCPFGGGGAGSPSNTMWPGARPTCVPSFILIRPTVWPQYNNVTDWQTDRQRFDSTGRTVLQMAAQKACYFILLTLTINALPVHRVLSYCVYCTFQCTHCLRYIYLSFFSLRYRILFWCIKIFFLKNFILTWYFRATTGSTSRYQVSFVVDNVEHDDDDGDSDEVWHEVTRRRTTNTRLLSRWWQWLAFCRLDSGNTAIASCTRQTNTSTVQRYSTYNWNYRLA